MLYVPKLIRACWGGRIPCTEERQKWQNIRWYLILIDSPSFVEIGLIVGTYRLTLHKTLSLFLCVFRYNCFFALSLLQVCRLLIVWPSIIAWKCQVAQLCHHEKLSDILLIELNFFTILSFNSFFNNFQQQAYKNFYFTFQSTLHDQALWAFKFSKLIVFIISSVM